MFLLSLTCPMAFVPIAAVLCSFPKGDRKDNTRNYEFSFSLHAKAFDFFIFFSLLSTAIK